MRVLLQTMRLIARDRGRVFAVSANRQVLSARDVEDTYAIYRGRGRAYVEFDAEESEVIWEFNKLTKEREATIVGDVNLNGRNPVGFNND